MKKSIISEVDFPSVTSCFKANLTALPQFDLVRSGATYPKANPNPYERLGYLKYTYRNATGG